MFKSVMQINYYVLLYPSLNRSTFQHWLVATLCNFRGTFCDIPFLSSPLILYDTLLLKESLIAVIFVFDIPKKGFYILVLSRL